MIDARAFLLVLGMSSTVLAESFGPGLMDPSTQPKFEEPVAEAMSDGFKVPLSPSRIYNIGMHRVSQETGLVDPSTGERLATPVLGYGLSKDGASWPGPTLEIQKDDLIRIRWKNELGSSQGLPFKSMDGKSVVDDSILWAYSFPQYEGVSLEEDGSFPTVVHVHGGRTRQQHDGNPEHFFTYKYGIRGPLWLNRLYEYDNDQGATALWYHDHTLGLTRLNNYAGLQGFYIIRDEIDTGKEDNPRGLPAGDYEKAYAIQDRFFKENGELFYPAYEGDPYYDDFIGGQGAELTDKDGATVLTEFFGDTIVVNGKVWPKQEVEPRRYRLRLLNGCDSRFLIIGFRAVDAGETSADNGETVSFTIVGADQGLQDEPIPGSTSLIIETGGRLDIVIDFSGYEGKRIIMTNVGGDQPFGGDVPGPQIFEYTNMLMSFDVQDNQVDDTSLVPEWSVEPPDLEVSNTRRLGLFEGRDAQNRLQPLLGAEKEHNIIETFTWSEPVTETPMFGTVEDWWIFNFSEDAHPIHLHRVKFRIVARYPITFDSKADDEGFCNTTNPDFNDLDGVCLNHKLGIQHTGPGGVGLKAHFPNSGLGYDEDSPVTLGPEFNAEIGGNKDIVTVLPGKVTVIRTLFDKVGRYVWHCHILSHEDSEMMRVYNIIHD